MIHAYWCFIGGKRVRISGTQAEKDLRLVCALAGKMASMKWSCFADGDADIKTRQIALAPTCLFLWIRKWVGACIMTPAQNGCCRRLSMLTVG